MTKTHFYHIPKTAGRSIIVSFSRTIFKDKLANDKDIYNTLVKNNGNYVFDNKKICGWQPKQYGKHYFTFGHHPYHANHCFDARKTLNYHITSLRKPEERVFSLYKEHLFEKKLKRAISTNINSKKNCMFSEGTFGNFIERLSQKRLLEQLYYFSDTYNIEEALVNVSNLNGIFLCGNIQETRDTYSGTAGVYLYINYGFSNILDYKVSKEEHDYLIERLEQEQEFYNKAKNIHPNKSKLNANVSINETKQPPNKINNNVSTAKPVKLITSGNKTFEIPEKWKSNGLVRFTISQGIEALNAIKIKVLSETHIINYGIPPLSISAPIGDTVVVAFSVTKKHKNKIVNRNWNIIKRGMTYECSICKTVDGNDIEIGK